MRKQTMASWLLMLIIPVFACGIVIRQHILQYTHDLSIWEGGGMGMFAAIGGFARTLKIYVVSPTGQRHPIMELTPAQEKLAGFLRKHPTQENFERLADVLEKTTWVAGDAKYPRLTVDKSGETVSEHPQAYYYLQPKSSVAIGQPYFLELPPKACSEGGNWDILIEFWKIRYDPKTRLAKAKLAEEFTAEGPCTR